MSGEHEVALGPGALAVLGVYLAVLLGLGWLGRVRRREESLHDFYLGGSSFGFVVLFLTLFATQYSGNTLLGFAGRSYQQGLSYVVSVTFMILVIAVILVYAPRLYRLSRRYRYVTPADYLFHRFQSHSVRILGVLLLCWGLANYILEQLVAMGHAMTAITGGRVGFMQGVALLAVVMLIYESLGGMRSVAWTDVVQGLLLLAGCGGILYVLLTAHGGLPAVAERVAETAPEKLALPDGRAIRAWISNLALLGIGAAIYPHAVQRIFAARDQVSLRRSLAAMSFMPLLTALLTFLLGFVALARFPGLDAQQSDQVTVLVLDDLAARSPWMHWLVVLVFIAVVAAIMSTADSALLSIASMISKDLYLPYIDPRVSARRLLRIGKVAGWALMALLILMAWVSLAAQSTLWLLIRLKMEFMVQLAPALILGLYWRRLASGPVFVGMLSGGLTTLAIWVGNAVAGWPDRSPWGISAGVWGLLLNVGCCLVGRWLWPAPDRATLVDAARVGA